MPGMPYELWYQIGHERWNPDDLLKVAESLATTYSTYYNQVELFHHFKRIDNITCLQKVSHARFNM